MASETTNGKVSDTETGEKPVREQLKKASIAGLPQDSATASEEGPSSTKDDKADTKNTEEPAGRSSLQRKRSFEELDTERPARASMETRKHHTRKRSRDSAAEDEEVGAEQRKTSGEKTRASLDEPRAANGASAERATTPELSAGSSATAAAVAVASPKNKRSRLHSAGIEQNGAFASDEPSDKDAPAKENDIPEKEDTKAASADKPATKVPATSGFANTSASSPFGALAGSKSASTEPAQTSSSAFAGSGFSALSSSSTSGFGALGKTTGGFGSGGGFGTGGKSPLGSQPAEEGEKAKDSSASTFGGALGQKSAFASAGSSSGGFGSGASAFGGSGFASLGGAASTGGLSSFASGKPTPNLASNVKVAKPFGAAADDDEEAESGEGNEENETGLLSKEEQKQDERFFAQDLETGEEGETTDYSCRAKLYNFVAIDEGKKEWRERGLGVLRLNVMHAAEGGDGKPKARFLMRAEGSHRVVLNTPIKKALKFGAPDGGPPQGSFMYFMGTIGEGDALELLQVKMKAQFATELYEKIIELQAEM